MKPSNRCPHSNTQRSAFLRACRLHAIKHKRSVNTSELGAQTRTVELGKPGYSGEHVTKGQRLMRNNGNACRLSRSKSTSMVTRHRSSSQVFRAFTHARDTFFVLLRDFLALAVRVLMSKSGDRFISDRNNFHSFFWRLTLRRAVRARRRASLMILSCVCLIKNEFSPPVGCSHCHSAASFSIVGAFARRTFFVVNRVLEHFRDCRDP
uniref:Uncharacterized protein n=1 Tax=Toxoplasma gondii COUG TaxID=1074873 RepID=A0A2G8Y684_TOXGO|nr:hypothetical protein TGCOUG_243700 [Toxoplasma gondii COUG]